MRRCILALAAATLAGCGLNVEAPDLFLLTRTGQGSKLTLLVNDAGTIRCNGSAPRHLPAPLLLDARDLAISFNADAQNKLRIPSPPNSVYRYTVRVQNGTIAFPDTAGRHHSELAQAQLFAVEAAQQVCRLPD